MFLRWCFLFVLMFNFCYSQNLLQGNYVNDLVNGFIGQQQPTPNLADSVFKQIGSFWSSNKDTITTVAGTLLSSGLDSIPDNVTSPICVKHIGLFLQALLHGEDWAVRMFDAFGKPGSDTKDYNYKWIGSYEECVAQKAIEYMDPVKKTAPAHSYSAKYCSVSFIFGQSAFGTLSAVLGTCLPETCSNKDVLGLVHTILDELPENLTKPLKEPTVTCQERSLPLTDKATVVIGVCIFFVAVIVAATAYDLVIHVVNTRQRKKAERTKLSDTEKNGHVNLAMPDDISHVSNGKIEKYEMNGTTNNVDTEKDAENKESVQPSIYRPGKFGQLLLAFSVYTNAPKILSAKQPAGALTCVNGIRFLSMTWVILGHTVGFGANTIDNASTYFPQLLKRFTFQAVVNATFSVDSFFVLSGLLVSYLSLKEMKKRKSALKFNWFMFYFHRYWRLTPPYMLFIMVYVTTSKYWAEGPFWNQAGLQPDECQDTWWKNVLYINNLDGIENLCMAWSWYLANDMQFYVISPIMLVPLFYSPVLGSICCLLLVTGSAIARGIISYHYGFGPNVIFTTNALQAMEEMYFRPWCRVGPYVVGFWTGYLLYKTNCKAKLSKAVVFLGWTISTALALTVLYGLYTKEGPPDLNEEVSALYNATSRTAWAVSLSWLVFACATGHGGPVNAILSWKGVISLSRLTYCAYLVHPVVLYYYYTSRKSLLHWDDTELVFLFLGVLCVSYAVAFVVSLAFESPMMGLEKVLLGRKKHS